VSTGFVNPANGPLPKNLRWVGQPTPLLFLKKCDIANGSGLIFLAIRLLGMAELQGISLPGKFSSMNLTQSTYVL